MQIFINTIKADKDDLQALKKAIEEKKDCIKRIAFFKDKIRIYTT